MTTFSLSVIGINQLYSGVGGYTPKIETYWTTFIIRVLNRQSLFVLPLRLDRLTFVIDVIVTPAGSTPRSRLIGSTENKGLSRGQDYHIIALEHVAS